MRPASIALLVNRRRRRENRRNQSAGPMTRRLITAAGLIIALLTAVAVIAAGWAYSSITADLPTIETLPRLMEPAGGWLLQPVRLFDRGGRLITDTQPSANVQRRFLSINPDDAEHLSPTLTDAAVAYFQPDFWQSPGVDWETLTDPKPRTIAERVVSELLLSGEPAGTRRALRMKLLAAQAVSQYGRAQVLEWFLNSAQIGRRTFGVDSAARLYFGKSAAELSLAESALLLGVMEKPALNPLDAPAAARDSQNAVLDQLESQGSITPAAAASARTEVLPLQSQPAETANPARTFTAAVLAQLTRTLGEERMALGGLDVTTSLDLSLQDETQCTLRTQLYRLESRAVPDSLTCGAAKLLPTIISADLYPASLNASAVIYDSRTGEVLAWVGDSDLHGETVKTLTHQPGSILTPFVAITGFTRGLGPASLVWDIPGVLPDEIAKSVSNDIIFHGPSRLRTALANDYRVPFNQMLQEYGAQTTWKTAETLGLQGLSTASNSDQLLLAGGDLSLAQLAQAYSAFANQGTLVGELDISGNISPVLVLSQNDVFISEPSITAVEKRPVLSAELAYLVHDILSDESARWPFLGHPNALEIGRPAGAKTGVTADSRQVWAAGYTTDWAVVTWLGLPQIENARLDVRAAAGVWHALIQYVSRGAPLTDWTVPEGIITLDVCDPSGLLPTASCPTVIKEIFAAGSEPTIGDTLYKTIAINRETNRLATVFTPPELVEQRVYMTVPTEAEEWARQAGIPLAPRDYDMIQAPVVNPLVNLTYPELFSAVRGNLSLQGTAGGSGFTFYRLQYGQGLNPQSWVQIGSDQDTPVSNGKLGVWDTTTIPDGLYALRLQVVYDDQTVKSATSQITVDNTAPVIFWQYPTTSQTMDTLSGGRITLQVTAEDQGSLRRVEWYVDGQRIGQSSSAPYLFNWQATHGKHTLSATAVDLAGNQSTTTPLEITIP